MIATDETLLDRIKRMDAHHAWQEFYDCYWAPIIRYARKLGLSETQAHDVLQETMVVLMRVLPRFTYDTSKGKFRNFLLTIVHRQSLAAIHRERRNKSDPWDEQVHSASHATHAKTKLAEQIDLERWQEAVAQEALRELQEDPSIEPRTWAVFKAYVVEGQDAAVVARAYGLQANAVYQIKNRLMTRLQKRTLQWLRDSGTDGEPPPK